MLKRSILFRKKAFFIFLLVILYVVNIILIFQIPTETLKEIEQIHPFDGFVKRNRKVVDENQSFLNVQQNKVKNMMLHAWMNYKFYAWGKNELDPLRRVYNNNTIFGGCEIGASIVDSLDTIFIMGLMKEYEEGRNWIANEFTLDNCDEFISVFELNIRFLGGFLSLYSLTRDKMYKEKAKYVADKMYQAFMTPSGIPYGKINIHQNKAEVGMTVLADCGSLSLEFSYLSHITNDAVYLERIKKINKELRKLPLEDGLYPYWVDPSTGQSISTKVIFGANADSFYEYLLKYWLQWGSGYEEIQEWFIETIDAVIKHLVKKSPEGLFYITDKYGNISSHQMDHVSCFAGGFFVLAAESHIHPNSSTDLKKIGKDITETCREIYKSTETGLGPDMVSFHQNMPDHFIAIDRSYKLRPEVVESYFYLWRLTHEQKYRDWAWDVVQAIEKHCRTSFGYTGLTDVYLEKKGYDGVQQSFFMSETLKYLFLIFSDDTLLDVTEYVFNTEGHPLPIFTRE